MKASHKLHRKNLKYLILIKENFLEHKLYQGDNLESHAKDLNLDSRIKKDPNAGLINTSYTPSNNS